MSKIESFEMEILQLNRTRRVWVYLPSNYSPSGAAQPVIYMHDGQNLFYDNLTAYGTAWHVDDALDKLFETSGQSAIVVGVECDGDRRLSEYGPWKICGMTLRLRKELPKHNRGGEGQAYAEFFATTLKQYIDSHYNTDSHRNATAVIGSSMGGLISCYLGLKYQQTYETMGLFSTYTPFNQCAFDKFVRSTKQELPQHAMIYCGGKEGLSVSDKIMEKCSVRLYQTLFRRGISCQLVLDSEMKHFETAWDVYFRVFAQQFLKRYYFTKQ